MISVALAEAKGRLSELVNLANAGEQVTITRRGKPVARIVANATPKRQLDLDALRRVAASMPYQEESAGEFLERVRAADLL